MTKGRYRGSEPGLAPSLATNAVAVGAARSLYLHGGSGTHDDPFRGSFMYFGTNFSSTAVIIEMPIPPTREYTVLRIRTVSLFYDSATAAGVGRVITGLIPVNINNVPNEHDIMLFSPCITTETLDGFTTHPDIELVVHSDDRAGMLAQTTAAWPYVQLNFAGASGTDDFTLYMFLEWYSESGG